MHENQIIGWKGILIKSSPGVGHSRRARRPLVAECLSSLAAFAEDWRYVGSSKVACSEAPRKAALLQLAGDRHVISHLLLVFLVAQGRRQEGHHCGRDLDFCRPGSPRSP